MAGAVKQPLIALDQFLNTLWWINGDGFGMADEMISARAFRAHLQGLISDVPMRAINLLFFWQSGPVRDKKGNLIGWQFHHCHRAWRSEWERAQLPSHYREAMPCC